MTSRRNRRRRHKRHKARTKNNRAVRLLAQWAYLRYRANNPQLTMFDCFMAFSTAKNLTR